MTITLFPEARQLAAPGVRSPTAAHLVLRMLRAAAGGIVSDRYLEAGIRGAGLGQSLHNAILSARRARRVSEELRRVAGVGYQLVPVALPLAAAAELAA